MKFLISLLITTFSLSLSTNSLAQPQEKASTGFQGWYQVEMIVFARNNPSQQEHFPTNIQLNYPSRFQFLKDPNQIASPEISSSDSSLSDVSSSSVAAAETTTIDFDTQPFYLLPASMRSLNFQANKISNSSDYQLLFHQAWRQKIHHKKQAEWILVNNHPLTPDAPVLSGAVRLSVAKYLRVETNLWFAEFEPKLDETPSPWPEIPETPENPELVQIIESEHDVSLLETNEIETQIEDNLESTDQNFKTKRILLLKEKAEMKSRQPNYIDHEIMGVIVIVTPFTPTVTTTESNTANPVQ